MWRRGRDTSGTQAGQSVVEYALLLTFAVAVATVIATGLGALLLDAAARIVAGVGG